MADDEGKQGDLKYYQNQPYDMEVDLNNDEEGDENENEPNQKKEKKENVDNLQEQEEENYNEVVAPKVKDLLNLIYQNSMNYLLQLKLKNF